MLVVACYLWRDPEWKHSGDFVYGPEHVIRLRAAVAKNLTVPHRFVCITNEAISFDDIDIVPLDLTTHIPGTEWAKLMTFHPDGAKLIGERVLQLDLDTVIVGNIDHIVNRNERLVVWRNAARVPWHDPIKFPGRALYNGSVILHQCGTMPKMWSFFDAKNPPRMRDTQEWMSWAIGPNAPYWDWRHGIYRIARDDTPGSGIDGALPDNACIVTFPGSLGKPWLKEIRDRNPWIADHWRLPAAA